MTDTKLTNIKKIMWDENEKAPVFVLEDNRIFIPTHPNMVNYGFPLTFVEVKEKWEDLDELQDKH